MIEMISFHLCTRFSTQPPQKQSKKGKKTSGHSTSRFVDAADSTTNKSSKFREFITFLTYVITEINRPDKILAQFVINLPYCQR